MRARGALPARFSLGLLTSVIAGCEPLDIELFGSIITPDAGSAPAASSGDAGATPSRPSSSRTCELGAEACEACVVEGSCVSPLACHPVSGRCVAPCSADAPVCPLDSLCDVSRSVCVECLSSNDCDDADRSACDDVRGECRECVIDAHCVDDPEERPTCLPELGVCGCDEDADCQSGICDIAEAHCEDEEEEDEDDEEADDS